MSVKAFMHPRNIYKNPPNFKDLAIAYPEFRKYVKQDIAGKVTFDFQNPNALRELTKTLLLKDFNLDVDITETKLIPTLPLRLNYILWVEDLLASAGLKDNIRGIDIGCGASCIYPLLAATKNWSMLGTEIDASNYSTAVENVTKNNLTDKISVRLVENTNTILVDVVDDDYDFCMCNPPFFSKEEVTENRTGHRAAPKNATSGTKTELQTDGGEVAFVKKIISESKELQGKIKVYSTMVGKKVDFFVLKNEIWKCAPKSYVTTEFCQGRTTRWGIAWTFLDLNLNKASVTTPKKTKKPKEKLPLQYFISKNETGNELQLAVVRTKELLEILEIKYKEDKLEDKVFAFAAKAYSNTWSHQRRKKRDVSEEPSAKKIKTEETHTSVILEFLIIIKEYEGLVNLEISWLAGSLGREGIHQVLQYLKNNWKIK